MQLAGVILFNFGFNFQTLGAQPMQVINTDYIQTNLEKLKLKYSFNKKVPREIQSNFYTAIGFYPELKDVNIKVRYGKIKTTMQCRPRWDFLFHKKGKRSYVIYIDSRIQKDNGVLYDKLPLNAQIGVIGHELGHIIDYHLMSNFRMMKFALDYLNSEKKKKIENRIDLIAIHRGLGHQIKDFSKYVFEDSGASLEYLKYKMKFYFQPNQINEILEMNPIYCTVSRNHSIEKS